MHAPTTTASILGNAAPTGEAVAGTWFNAEFGPTAVAVAEAPSDELSLNPGIQLLHQQLSLFFPSDIFVLVPISNTQNG